MTGELYSSQFYSTWYCVHKIYKLVSTLQTISSDLVIQAEIVNLLKGVEAHVCVHN